MKKFHLEVVHPSWRECIEQGLETLDFHYLQTLYDSEDWLPGHEYIFNAFTLPVSKVQYVLFGESPYPRKKSAIGYAFWDGDVDEIWSPTGLSKKVNRATSLRNIVKMMLLAEGLLNPNKLSQEDIAALDKSHLIQTNQQLFENFQRHGILLLNACPVLQKTSRLKDARAWKPFLATILKFLIKNNPNVKFIYLGKIANNIEPLVQSLHPPALKVEHPYNHSFITNFKVLDFFKPLHLLKK
ncbi:MAG: uracil-DNA glycosylase [Gammaproteobacteria bacterium]|nr:uracil-DNA glycosylase [Gammaproteobacteria bacterium]